MNCYHSYGPYPQPSNHTAHMTGGEEKSKLTIDRPRLGSMRMWNLANFLSYPLVRGIGLGGLELVIMSRGRIREGDSLHREGVRAAVSPKEEKGEGKGGPYGSEGRDR